MWNVPSKYPTSEFYLRLCICSCLRSAVCWLVANKVVRYGSLQRLTSNLCTWSQLAPNIAESTCTSCRANELYLREHEIRREWMELFTRNTLASSSTFRRHTEVGQATKATKWLKQINLEKCKSAKEDGDLPIQFATYINICRQLHMEVGKTEVLCQEMMKMVENWTTIGW